MNTNEEWRAIPGHEGYEASAFGRIRGSRGILRDAPLLAGYRKTCLGTGVQGLVHRWVILAFRGPCPKGWYVAHKNGDPADNRIENLMYCTPRANTLHRRFHGKAPCPVLDAIKNWNRNSHHVGESHWMCASTEKDVHRVHKLSAEGLLDVQIAEKMKRSRSWVGHIISGRRWRHLHPDPSIRDVRRS